MWAKGQTKHQNAAEISFVSLNITHRPHADVQKHTIHPRRCNMTKRASLHSWACKIKQTDIPSAVIWYTFHMKQRHSNTDVTHGRHWSGWYLITLNTWSYCMTHDGSRPVRLWSATHSFGLIQIWEHFMIPVCAFWLTDGCFWTPVCLSAHVIKCTSWSKCPTWCDFSAKPVTYVSDKHKQAGKICKISWY